jgi:hypothetical protein
MNEGKATNATGGSALPDSTASLPGRGRRGQGRKGRSRGRGGRYGSRNNNTRNTNTMVQDFKGNTDGMKGNVFQCHGENTNKQQFLKTIGVLDEHINKTFTYPQDIASICKTFTIMPLVQPANLTKQEYEGDMGKKMIWKMLMKTYMKRIDMLESNQRSIYAIVWGQFSPMMQSKLESLDSYESKSNRCDCIWLLQESRAITHCFEGTCIAFISLDDA